MINLSSRSLNQHELAVLSKGLSFVPSQQADPFTTKVELFKFFRSVKLKAFFAKDNSPQPLTAQLRTSTEPTAEVTCSVKAFKPKSTFVPQVLNASVNTFCRLVDQEASALASSAEHNKCFSNLTPPQRHALIELSNDESIVIRKADKGGAIVLQDIDNYRKELKGQLSNTDNYTLLPHDPTVRFSKEIKDTLDVALSNGSINNDEYKFMLNEHVRRPTIYTVPKVHKVCTPSVPGRPIVAGNGSATEPISQFVDTHIKGLVQKLPSYLKDTTDFLNKLKSIENDINETDILCSVDVASLFTSVPHKEGLEALRHYLETRETQTPPVELLMDLAETILNKNYFKF